MTHYRNNKTAISICCKIHGTMIWIFLLEVFLLASRGINEWKNGMNTTKLMQLACRVKFLSWRGTQRGGKSNYCSAYFAPENSLKKKVRHHCRLLSPWDSRHKHSEKCDQTYKSRFQNSQSRRDSLCCLLPNILLLVWPVAKQLSYGSPLTILQYWRTQIKTVRSNPCSFSSILHRKMIGF